MGVSFFAAYELVHDGLGRLGEFFVVEVDSGLVLRVKIVDPAGGVAIGADVLHGNAAALPIIELDGDGWAQRDASCHTKIWIAKTDIFPRFFLTGAIGRLADSGHALLKDENTLWAFGPYFTWPILDMGKILANVDAKTSQQKQALINYEKTVISSLKDVETSLVGYGKKMKDINI